MNYSRNIKKKDVGKRILISWLIVAVFFFFVGIAVSLTILHGYDDGDGEEQAQGETLKYGEVNEQVLSDKIRKGCKQ